MPCPSAADPARNPHRSGGRWTLTAVGAILANPRYTGRQVWNRQRTDHELIDPANTALGHRDIARWGLPQDWAISRQQAHPAPVSEADFVAVQGMRATTTTPRRTYLLAGLLHCGLCGRRMDSCWSHDRRACRCRHGRARAGSAPDRPRNTYIREDRVLAHLPALLLRPTPGDEPTDPEAAAARLRAADVTLTYDPADQTLTAGTPTRERIRIG